MKIPPDISIAGLHTALAPTVATATALEEGKVARLVAETVGARQLPAATEPGAPRLAIEAAHAAMEGARIQGEEIDILVHAWIHHQGHDFWSPAHHIAHEVGADNALPVGVQTMCNGGETAIEIAVARLICDPDATTAVVTTADIFAGGFDRWNSDSFLWYGDAGTALVLTTEPRPGHPKLLACAATTVLDGEGLHRGSDPYTWAPRQHGDIVDVRRTKKAHLQSGSGDAFNTSMRDALRHVIRTAVHDAGLSFDSPRLRFLALPRVGRKVIGDLYVPAVEDLTNAEIVYLGDHSGHLGAGDTPANLTDLIAQENHAPDDIGLFVCAGGGFTVSCLAVELGTPGIATVHTTTDTHARVGVAS
ncbi:3-oxoacyl-ACP synthase [Microbacterium sp.]|uniref:3-oxoacyl-ACP synthase n=1 Tax=Microbacterium sp. TaxID=51671 RepID=UPI003A8AA64F